MKLQHLSYAGITDLAGGVEFHLEYQFLMIEVQIRS
jgi:hypothetical protein